MTTELTAALRQLGSRRADLELLAIDLSRKPLLFNTARLPPRPRPAPSAGSTGAADTALPPMLSAEEVVLRWRQGGAVWLRGCKRGELQAAAAAVRHPMVGPVLAREDEFVAVLVSRLRRSQRQAVLQRLWFHHYPPSPVVERAFAALREEVPARAWPHWWAWLGSGPSHLLRQMAESLRTTEWGVTEGELGFPEEASGPAWADPICGLVKVTDLAYLERTLRFADRGRTLSEDSPLSEGGKQVVRHLVQAAEVFAQEQGRVAALLRRRLGDVFEASPTGAWYGLEPERRRVKAWVAGEILDLLFKHLVAPSSWEMHQTEPRRLFWRRYTHRVERMWLLLEGQMTGRLLNQDVQTMLERAEGLVEVRKLKAPSGRAVVWMQLRARNGGLVTVVEGNANTSFRLRAGAHAPLERVVTYFSIQHRYFPRNEAEVRVLTHHGGRWEADVEKALLEVGVVP